MTDDTPYTCDRCGQPLVPGQLLYGLAHNPDRRTGRHAACHVDPLDEMRRALGETRDSLDKLRRTTGLRK